jgi:predicted RNA binding protein YcfA (HicA-like mRNA interferase family)
MPPFGPINRRELIRGLKKLGFSGPFASGKHEFMVREADQLRLFVPYPYKDEISRPLLGEILLVAGISRAE